MIMWLRSNGPVVGQNVGLRLVALMMVFFTRVVQGAGFEDLRRQSAQDLVSMDFPGYSMMRSSCWESHEEMNAVLDFTTPAAPGQPLISWE